MVKNLVKELSEQEFEQKVIKSKIPVLVDFFASWCAPCLIMAPILSKITEEHKDKIKVEKVNVDKNQRLAAKYKVMSLPTILVFHQGKIVNQITGVVSEDELEKKIKEFL